jgi:solute carrier family 25 (mitochondrial phosphate transporter), member 3
MKLHAIASLLTLAVPGIESSGLQALDYRYFVAGGASAALSHGLTTPIDVIKTRIQASPDKYKDGFVDAASQIVQEDGISVLTGGLGPTIVGYGVEGALKFGLYEVLKPVVVGAIDNMQVAYLVAAIVAGAVASLVLCPIESARIRIVTNPKYADMGLIESLARILQTEGVATIFAGIFAMLAKQVPYTFGKQVSFDVLTQAMYQSEAIGASLQKVAIPLIAAAGASIVACILSQPGDMILTETYKSKPPKVMQIPLNGVRGRRSIQGFVIESTSSPKLESEAKKPKPVDPMAFSKVVGDLFAQGGLAQFFTGTRARLLHVGLIITSQLVIYDFIKQFLGLPATGSN